MDDVLILKDIYKSVGGREILRGFNLNIKRGERVLIKGDVGKGKSLLLKIVLGLVKPDRGYVRLLGKPPFKLRSKVGFLTLPPLLVEDRSVLVNITFVLEALGRRSDVLSLLRFFDVEHLAREKVKHLSFKEKAKICLVREIAKEPELIFLDEPFLFLNEFDFNKLVYIGREREMAILMTSSRNYSDPEDFRVVEL